MTNEQDNPPRKILGQIGSGEHDATLNAPKPAPVSHRRDAPNPPSEPSVEPDAVLMLPRGALIALRKSGGLAFSSHEIIIYRNGRVLRRGYGTGQPRYADAAQHLAQEQLAELTLLLKQAVFPRFPGEVRQSSDTLVIEITARIGRRVKTAEASQTSLPVGLAPLVRWLTPLLGV